MTSRKATKQYELVLGTSTAADKVHSNGNFWLYEEEHGWGNPEPEVNGLYIKQAALGDDPPQRVRMTLDWQD